MNSTTAQTQSATFIAFVAGLLAGKGVFGLDAATWAAVLGAFAYLGTVLWNAWTTRQQAIVNQALASSKPEVVSAVAKLDEVKNITLDASQPGTQELNAATPSNVRPG